MWVFGGYSVVGYGFHDLQFAQCEAIFKVGVDINSVTSHVQRVVIFLGLFNYDRSPKGIHNAALISRA